LKSLRACLVVSTAVILLLALGAGDALARNVYVGDNGHSVFVIDTATETASPATIGVGEDPMGIAITPDGKTAYVVNAGEGTVSVVDTATSTTVKTIKVGTRPFAIAITPDGRKAYVANFTSGDVSVIDTATNTASQTPIDVGNEPDAIAITPDGRTAYVANYRDDEISVLSTATDSEVGERIKVGDGPSSIAITPDGRTAYVSNEIEGTVSALDTASSTVSGARIEVGDAPFAIAVTPDGQRAYVANLHSDDVSAIDTSDNTIVASSIPVGKQPLALAITPDGRSVYVVNAGSNDVSVIDTATNTEKPKTISVGNDPEGIAIAPDQPPVAAFATPAAPIVAGTPVTFDASASRDPDSPITNYAFFFRDGQSQTGASASATHTFTTPGTYKVTLTTVDAEGCSTPETFSFTGLTAYCNGSASAQTSRQVTVVAAPAPAAKVPNTPGLSFGKLKTNAKKGTATLTVNFSGPATGTLALAGKGLRKSVRKLGGERSAQLVIATAGKAHRTLLAKGKFKARFVVTFSPAGAKPVRVARGATLRRHPKRRRGPTGHHAGRS